MRRWRFREAREFFPGHTERERGAEHKVLSGSHFAFCIFHLVTHLEEGPFCDHVHPSQSFI